MPETKYLEKSSPQPVLSFHPTSLVQPNFVRNQIKWWCLVTGCIALITLVPGYFLAREVQNWIEIFDSFVITFGVRTLALLSKLIIEKLFKFLNEGKLVYVISGGNFFTNDNPLIQYLWERRIRNAGRARKVRDRAHQLASHKQAWLVLIVLSYIARLAPDMLGASLVAQNDPFRIVEPIENVVAPDLGFGYTSGLQFRGNCVWARVGSTGTLVVGARERRKMDKRFGYIIWQYCVDLFRGDEIEMKYRTLKGKDQNGEEVQAVFHIEVITEDIFTEEWEPFSNMSHAQKVFKTVLSSTNECPNEFCIKNYRTEDMRIVYGLLQKVGMHERELNGDDESLEKLRVSTGRIIARLPQTTRTSFLVLIVAVNVVVLAQSASNAEEEVEHIALFRAIGELMNIPGASHFTAIALPRANMARRWMKCPRESCFVVGRDSCSSGELLEKFPEACAVHDEEGHIVSYTKHGMRYVKAFIDSDVYQWGRSVEKNEDDDQLESSESLECERDREISTLRATQSER
ncbi:unnamed protein product [Agarophyton chilense]|eukprot:gb/GEZJ01000052.1/.p1 GENE.gb/GEZJ01000052.1/~~gb/GEZJ01000052.1/.p1  ORF type:complete len:517 (-),score=73.81 gb/GEZJ01000052.1/:3268-4818(-)